MSQYTISRARSIAVRLEALPAIIRFTSITKITGDTNGKQPFLYVDKVVGGVNFCIGLRIDEKIDEYIPRNPSLRV